MITSHSWPYPWLIRRSGRNHSASSAGGAAGGGTAAVPFAHSCRIADVSHFDFASPALRPHCGPRASNPYGSFVSDEPWESYDKVLLPKALAYTVGRDVI